MTRDIRACYTCCTMRLKPLKSIALCAALALMSVTVSAQELTDATLKQRLDSIVPKPEETRWQQIFWRPSFVEAVVEAQKSDKPLLIWAMNGHPLGCT